MGFKTNDNEIRDWVIYLIISPSGRRYIGKSCRFKYRMKEYGNNNCKSQPILYKSFIKYGFSNHTVEIIEEFKESNVYAVEREMFWINQYKTNRSKWPKYLGMNLTDGGEGTIGSKPSVETRKKQSLAKKGKSPANKGKPMPLHQKELLRLINIGRIPHNKGSKFQGTDDERKEKFGKHNIGNSYNKGRKQRPEFVEARIKRQTGKPLLKKMKPILQYSLDGIFIKEHPSVQDAAINTGISRAGLNKILAGEIKNPQSFRFKYKGKSIFTPIVFERRIFKQQDLNKKIA